MGEDYGKHNRIKKTTVQTHASARITKAGS
jgi:hypothetical protein